jgi:hypothetical protein
MDTPKEACSQAVSQAVENRIKRVFWELDDLMVLLSPDAPAHVAEAWSALYKGMSPEFIKRRDEFRGLGG